MCYGTDMRRARCRLARCLIAFTLRVDMTEVGSWGCTTSDLGAWARTGMFARCESFVTWHERA